MSRDQAVQELGKQLEQHDASLSVRHQLGNLASAVASRLELDSDFFSRDNWFIQARRHASEVADSATDIDKLDKAYLVEVDQLLDHNPKLAEATRLFIIETVGEWS